MKGDNISMIDKINLETINRMDLFFQLFSNMRDLVFLTEIDHEGTFRYVLANQPAMGLLGLTEDSFGKPINQVLPESAFELIQTNYYEAMERKEPVTYEDQFIVPLALTTLETNTYSPNQLIYWESTITPVFNQEGECTHFLAIVRDITERREKQNELKRANDRFELIWNSVADAMYTFDKRGHFVSVNKSFEKIFGWKEEELLKDHSIGIYPEDSKKSIKEIIERNRQGETIPSHEVKRVTRDGKIIHVLASYSPLYDERGNWEGAVVIYKDITERKKYEETLKYLAIHDDLTGLPNRKFFYDKLKEELVVARQTKKHLAILFLDIDKFKSINDSMGHDIGDEVIKEFAQRVKRSVKDEDTLARFGGDEFVLLLSNLDSQKEIMEVVDRILQEVSQDLRINTSILKITTSIGIAFYTNFNLDEKTILKQADIALYQAKEKGRNNYQIYQEETG